VSPHFGWYSFFIPLRVEGWVAGYEPRWFTCPQMVTYPSTNRSSRVTSLIEANALPLSQPLSLSFPWICTLPVQWLVIIGTIIVLYVHSFIHETTMSKCLYWLTGSIKLKNHPAKIHWAFTKFYFNFYAMQWLLKIFHCMLDIQRVTAEIKRGKKQERRDHRDENIMSAFAMQGGHNKLPSAYVKC